jgi:hypothetical protein
MPVDLSEDIVEIGFGGCEDLPVITEDDESREETESDVPAEDTDDV